MNKYVAMLVIVLVFPGCGGLREEVLPQASAAYQPGQGQQATAVKLGAVRNSTGDGTYDDLRHYVHIKTAEALSNTGKFLIVSDDILSTAFTEDLQISQETATHIIDVELLDIKEKIGGTAKIAIFSSQEKRARVSLRLTLRDAQTGNQRSSEADAVSTKGAWGVVAEVNRESMIKSDGIWKLDNSMLGVATIRALNKAIAGLSN